MMVVVCGGRREVMAVEAGASVDKHTARPSRRRSDCLLKTE